MFTCNTEFKKVVTYGKKNINKQNVAYLIFVLKSAIGAPNIHVVFSHCPEIKLFVITIVR